MPDKVDPTIKQIVHDWLAWQGYDGLFLSGYDCGCRLNDLMPCDEPHPGCTAGIFIEDEEDPPSGHDWLIGPRDTGEVPSE